MKRIVIIIAAFLLTAGWNVSGFCQEGSSSDTELEQSESSMEQDLGSEMGSEESQAQGEMDQMESSTESNDLSR